jgi:hypothetical protein
MPRKASKKYIRLKVALILWVQLFFYLQNKSQSPSHFFIGQNELAGIDIYSIYKSKNKSLFIGTSNGVFVYKQGVFQELSKSPEQRGASFFQIQENSKGKLFCSNLHGQLFELRNDSIVLFFELPKEEVGDQFHFFIDSENNIVYASNLVGKISVKKEKSIIIKPNCDDSTTCQYFHASKIKENQYFICHSLIEKSIIYDNGEITYFNFSNLKDKEKLLKSNSIRLIHLMNEPLIVENSGSIYTGNSIFSDLSNSPSERFFKINENKILALNSKSGARFLSIENDTLRESKKILSNLFISAADVDEMGRLYLGTFGNGVCIVPNIDNNSITIDASLRGITVSEGGKCYVSSKEGKVFRVHQDSTSIIYESSRTQDWIYHCNNCGNSELEKLIFDPIDDGNVGVIKDFYFPSAQAFGFIATSIGIFKIGELSEEYQHWLEYGTNQTSQLSEVTGRQKAVTYDFSNKILYFSDESDLFQVNSKGQKQKILCENKNVFANDLEMKGDTLICATEDNGLIFFKEKKPILRLNLSNGLTHEKIKKIKVIGEKLLILSQGGFQTLSLNSLQFQTYGVPEGLIENTIIDFDANDKRMYFLIKNKVLILPYAQTEVLPEDISISINSITLGGNQLDLNHTNSFQYNQNNLKLLFDFKSEILNNETSVFYKLSGINNEEWNEIPVNAKSIQYPSLAPGKYTLILETRCRNVISKQFSISFKIKSPFWQQWWFYLLIAFSLITLSFLFYRRRLKIQNLKSQQINELNASKLTAIQSQMNPHFIFNALNSIQALVLKGDVENSYSFITKFSNLVRRTLNYSDKDFISFNQEIKLIELYLSLEKLRFKDDLEYEIIENEIDDINVPPMLIQPFIENALLHGLLHKAGKKKITISFELGKTLICTITDNGIGRKKSEEIKTRQRSEHESFSGNAIKRRFEILENHFGGSLGFTYKDLKENNVSSGTEVILRIPVKKEF